MPQKLVCSSNASGPQKISDISLAEHDLVIIGGGVAGYVAAIKAGQEGMKVACPFILLSYTVTYDRLGGMHRKAGSTRWNLSKRWLHTLEIPPQ